MKYWIRFSLRMLASTGLLMAVLLWALGQVQLSRSIATDVAATRGTSQASNAALRIGEGGVLLETGPRAFQLRWDLPRTGGWDFHDILFNQAVIVGSATEEWVLTGVKLTPESGMRSATLIIAHWFSCLVFFLATVLTWKRPARDKNLARSATVETSSAPGDQAVSGPGTNVIGRQEGC